MPRSFIASVFERDKHNYDKETGSSTGQNSLDTRSFSERVISQVQDVQSGKFLSGGANRITERADAFQEIIKDHALGGLRGRIAALADADGNLFKKIGLGSVVKMLSAVENAIGGIVDELGDALLSRLHIPDPVYLASLIAFDLAGADLEYNNNYIRRLILRRDITIALKWWNKTWEIEYSGLRSDRYTVDGLIAARAGAYKNVQYILNEFNNRRREMESEVESIDIELNDETTSEENKLIYEFQKENYLKLIEECTQLMIMILKELIVYSYSNFTADELKDMLEKYNIRPSVFGTNDPEYGSKFSINSHNVNIMAPFYRPAITRQVDRLSQNRSSRHRRKIRREQEKSSNPRSNPMAKISDKLHYINPRNRNIKRLYIVLAYGDNFHDSELMFNKELARRLGYRIISTAELIAARALQDLIPSEVFSTMDSLWRSAFTYTREIEHLLFDPSKVNYLRWFDTEVIKTPEEYKKSTLTPETGSSDQDTTSDMERSIGSVLLADFIRDMLNRSREQIFINPRFYDNDGNIVQRNDDGDYIVVDRNGNPLLDSNGEEIIVDPSNVNTSVPIENKNLADILPDDFDLYIRTVVNEYLSLNLVDITRNVLNEIALGNIILNSTEAIERLILRYRLVSYSEINMHQVIPILLERLVLTDGIRTYDGQFLSSRTLTEILTKIVNELKDSGEYIPVFNNLREVNILKIMLGEIQVYINEILRGRNPEIDDFNSIYNRAIIRDSEGFVSRMGAMDDALYLTIDNLNNRIEELSRDGRDTIDFYSLTGGKSFVQMMDESQRVVDSGIKIDRSISKLRAEMLNQLEEITSLVKNGILTVDDIPNFENLVKSAREGLASKTDLTELMNILRDFGVDLDGYDIMEYHREKDKLIHDNHDEGFFEFDINNPPPHIMRSIKEEYNNKFNIRSKYYIWVDPEFTFDEN